MKSTFIESEKFIFLRPCVSSMFVYDVMLAVLFITLHSIYVSEDYIA